MQGKELTLDNDGSEHNITTIQEIKKKRMEGETLYCFCVCDNDDNEDL